MVPTLSYYDAAYAHFASPLYSEIRMEAFGEDIGQNSWATADEYRRFYSLLKLTPGGHALDVACGSGGPTLLLAGVFGCRVTGIDFQKDAVQGATALAAELGLGTRATFQLADAGDHLPFADETFDAVVCIDAINHLSDRPAILREWHRVLKPRRPCLFTDPAVITGLLHGAELAIRSSNGPFVFAPAGQNERLLESGGFHLDATENVTASVFSIAKKRREARDRHRAELLVLETEGVFQRQQDFLAIAEKLALEQRLSRFLFLALRS